MQLFKPKISVPEPQAAPPTIDEAANRQDYTDRLRRRRGASSTVLVKDASAQAAPQAASAILGG